MRYLFVLIVVLFLFGIGSVVVYDIYSTGQKITFQNSLEHEERIARYIVWFDQKPSDEVEVFMKFNVILSEMDIVTYREVMETEEGQAWFKEALDRLPESQRKIILSIPEKQLKDRLDNILLLEVKTKNVKRTQYGLRQIPGVRSVEQLSNKSEGVF